MTFLKSQMNSLSFRLTQLPPSPKSRFQGKMCGLFPLVQDLRHSHKQQKPWLQEQLQLHLVDLVELPSCSLEEGHLSHLYRGLYLKDPGNNLTVISFAATSCHVTLFISFFLTPSHSSVVHPPFKLETCGYLQNQVCCNLQSCILKNSTETPRTSSERLSHLWKHYICKR